MQSGLSQGLWDTQMNQALLELIRQQTSQTGEKMNLARSPLKAKEGETNHF